MLHAQIYTIEATIARECCLEDLHMPLGRGKNKLAVRVRNRNREHSQCNYTK